MVGNHQASTILDATFFAQYDALVRAALDAGAYVMLDLHNYARWNGAIVGQGGPSNDEVRHVLILQRHEPVRAEAQFANVWKLLATAYKAESKVIFGQSSPTLLSGAADVPGVMNEPHNVPDNTKW
jgi:endoglucanase